MTGFKVGDQIWFFWTDCGRYCWGSDETIIYPKSFNIECGIIVSMNPNKDYVHVYVDGTESVCNFGYVFHYEYFFKTKQEALNEMINRLEEMKND